MTHFKVGDKFEVLNKSTTIDVNGMQLCTKYTGISALIVPIGTLWLP